MYKTLICLAVLAAVGALGTSASAQEKGNPIKEIAGMACRTGEPREITVDLETGYMVMLGITADTIHSARYLKAASPEGGRELIDSS